MPTETITFDRVAERISVLLSVPVEKLTPETELHDLGADSFRLVETVVDLQEEFDSMFTQAELKQVTTLAQLVELLRAQR
jgi:acyl carrier protein